MSIGVCVFCGSIKHGAFTPCQSCKKIPHTEAELTHSAMFSSHCFPPEMVQSISNEVRSGKPWPLLSPRDQDYARLVAREWMASEPFQIAKDMAVRGVSTGKAEAPRKSSLIRHIFFGYACIGALLGMILYGSYIWPLTWGSSRYAPEMSFGTRMLTLVIMQPLALGYLGVRTITWGPSLIIWMLDETRGYSFGKWLVPGLYMEIEKTAPSG